MRRPCRPSKRSQPVCAELVTYLALQDCVHDLIEQPVSCDGMRCGLGNDGKQVEDDIGGSAADVDVELATGHRRIEPDSHCLPRSEGHVNRQDNWTGALQK